MVTQGAGDPQTYAIIGAAMEVHNHLGRGFLELVYQDALEVEFKLCNIPYEREADLSILYKGQKLEGKYRADFICFDNVIVELKAIKQITNIERAQIINYLKATGYPVGLLINFAEGSLTYERFVN